MVCALYANYRSYLTYIYKGNFDRGIIIYISLKQEFVY